jgi:competence protein ComEA
MKILRQLFVLSFLLCAFPASSDPIVNINTADSEKLVDDLVGIGPQKAMAIIRYRQQHGPFKQAEDLTLVTGIGVKTVEQNRARITVADPKTDP